MQPEATLDVEVVVRNPFARREAAEVVLVVPAGWRAEPGSRRVRVDPHGERRLAFRVAVGPDRVRRGRIAADVTVADVRFGQQAEALVTVL